MGISKFGLDRLNLAQLFPADLNIGNHRITNLANPTSSNDAATKSYVDGIGGSALHVTVGPYSWCDFVTDDVSDEVQINQAIQYCKNNPGFKSVFLVAPSYTLSGTITIDVSIEFYGSTMLSTTIYCNSGIAINVTAHGCNLHGFSLSSSGGAVGDIGLKLSSVYNTLVTHVNVYSFYTGINIFGGASNELHNVKIQNCVNDGILLDGDTTEATIIYASIWGSDITFAGLRLTYASGSLISNVDIMKCKIGLLIDPGFSQVCHWNMFSQCQFDTCTAGQGWGAWIASPDGVIRGVFMDMLWVASNSRGILVSSNVNGIYLNDPIIFSNQNEGLIANANSCNVKVHGGMIGVNSINANTTQVSVDTPGYVEFSNVQFGKQIMSGPSNPSWHIVFTGNVRDALVSGCHFADSGSNGKISDSSGGYVTLIGNNKYP